MVNCPYQVVDDGSTGVVPEVHRKRGKGKGGKEKHEKLKKKVLELRKYQRSFLDLLGGWRK